MNYALTPKRYKLFRQLFEKICHNKPSHVIFAYGPNCFKFKLGNRTIEVNKGILIRGI